MKRIALLATLAAMLSSTTSQADEKADKCSELKQEILQFCSIQSKNNLQQQAKAGIAEVMLNAYQAAQCPPLPIDDALKITRTIQQ